ncbi:hypothetical protein [uncultured Alistipes sp.]|uniref:hypothetical protein n=1 Tax=uncultured Alistipes sp. TaxID=538949 RepID=UPI0025E8F72C|nr:hypothetical protein [uncultured Alistipes sp.]
MNISEIKNIIDKNRSDIAFVIGNGINRYPGNPDALSWDNLLINLWDKVSFRTLSKRPAGISLTEFYDVLELENTQDINLQKEVAQLMADWEPMAHHRLIAERIRALDAPILTTNFEETFAKAIAGYSLLRTEREKFTDFYPWTTYHGQAQFQSPADGFGIWYINGMINYHRSIRLGLSHYMGSAERARTMLHKGKDCLLRCKDRRRWKGSKTWLHLIFSKSLFIFGLGLEENETFLRWLLIERTKYFKKFPARKHKGWYITTKNSCSTDAGKKFFLEHVGFEVIEVDDYSDIYEKIWR